MICTMPQCQTTAGCKCQDLQRQWENRELELLRKIEKLVICREAARVVLDAGPSLGSLDKLRDALRATVDNQPIL